MNERPISNDYDPFYETYIQFVPDGDLVELLNLQIREIRSMLDGICEKQTVRLHAPYTWTLKQLVGHLIDAEKIFGCRAHRFACNDQQPVPGMDQNDYVNALTYDEVDFNQLIDEWEHTRRSNLLFLKRIPRNTLQNRGVADGKSITVLALACIMYGHVAYHAEIIGRRLENVTS